MLKANHGCGMNLFVTDIKTIDEKSVRKTAANWLSTNYYRKTQEWAYGMIPPMLMAEKFLHDNRGYNYPADFKISCFDGVPRYLAIFLGRTTPAYQVGRYTINGMNIVRRHITVRLPNGNTLPESDWTSDVPEDVLQEMLGLASSLSEGIDHIRVDLYHTGEGIYFGEMTPYYTSGLMKFDPEAFNIELGSWWKQPY